MYFLLGKKKGIHSLEMNHTSERFIKCCGVVLLGMTRFNKQLKQQWFGLASHRQLSKVLHCNKIKFHKIKNVYQFKKV